MKITRTIILFCLLIGPKISICQEPINVVSSASIFQDMVKRIGKDKVKSMCIVPIGGDPHLYEPKPSDAQLIKSADLLLVNGLTFEGWISKLIDNSQTNAPIITITEGIEPLKSEKYKNAADPHAWMSAANGLIYIKNIKNALQKVDPSNYDFYESNHATYALELEALDKYIFEKIKSIPEKQRMLITSHDAFAYYGRRYGINLNALKGISTESEAQTSDMVRVANAIKESKVPAIFIESTINPKVIQQIATDNGVKIGGELFADSIGDEDSEANSYADMLRHNTDVITNALSQDKITLTKIDSDDTSSKGWIYGLIGVIMLGGLIFMISKMQK